MSGTNVCIPLLELTKRNSYEPSLLILTAFNTVLPDSTSGGSLGKSLNELKEVREDISLIN